MELPVHLVQVVQILKMENKAENQYKNKDVGDFPNLKEKVLIITLNLVEEALPNLISTLISEKKEEGMTYEQIGELFKIARSSIYNLEKKIYFPKTKKGKLELLKKYLELI